MQENNQHRKKLVLDKLWFYSLLNFVFFPSFGKQIPHWLIPSIIIVKLISVGDSSDNQCEQIHYTGKCYNVCSPVAFCIPLYSLLYSSNLTGHIFVNKLKHPNLTCIVAHSASNTNSTCTDQWFVQSNTHTHSRRQTHTLTWYCTHIHTECQTCQPTGTHIHAPVYIYILAYMFILNQECHTHTQNVKNKRCHKIPVPFALKNIRYMSTCAQSP